MKELKEEIEKLRKGNRELKAEIYRINEKVENMDRETRRNNFVAHGLQMESKSEHL
jgi:predicted RNase H-like nuclease (RuvC/YqgF family)